MLYSLLQHNLNGSLQHNIYKPFSHLRNTLTQHTSFLHKQLFQLTFLVKKILYKNVFYCLINRPSFIIQNEIRFCQ